MTKRCVLEGETLFQAACAVNKGRSPSLMCFQSECPSPGSLQVTLRDQGQQIPGFEVGWDVFLGQVQGAGWGCWDDTAAMQKPGWKIQPLKKNMHSRGQVPAQGSKNQLKLANTQLGTGQLWIHGKWEKIGRLQLWGSISGRCWWHFSLGKRLVEGPSCIPTNLTLN